MLGKRAADTTEEISPRKRCPSFRGEGSAAIPLGGEPPPTPEDPYSWHRNGLVQKTRSLAQPLVYSPYESLSNTDARD